VESDDFTTEEVVTVGDVGWDLDVPLTTSLVESVDGPGTTVEALLLDLEPVETGNVALAGGAVDLGKVDNDGSLVGGSNWVITVGGALLTVGVVPLNLDSRSSGDCAGASSRLVSVDVASKVGAGHLHDGVVVWCQTDARLSRGSLGVGGPEPLNVGVTKGSLGHHGSDSKSGKTELHFEDCIKVAEHGVIVRMKCVLLGFAGALLRLVLLLKD